MSATDPIEVTPSRTATVGSMTVRRALPRKGRRTVGSWCFADHMGPATVAEGDAGIGPHPHIGLQTVTWLVRGEVVHRDSLGSEQPIRPGQLNLMTAGRGVAHAEHTTTPGDELHGIQLWVAQPERTRNADAAFEHHAELPQLALTNATATVLVGAFDGVTSPARRDTDHLGVDLDVHGGKVDLPVRAGDEHAFVVLEGQVDVAGEPITTGQLCFLPPGRDEIGVHAATAARVMVLGGPPFESEIVMWWNFVARTHDEVDDAAEAWQHESERFPETGSWLPRIAAPPRPWRS